MNYGKTILLACVLAIAGPALAEEMDGGPPAFALNGSLAATSTKSLINGPVKLGPQTIWLERTKLKAVAQDAGALVRQRGDGDSALKWICLTPAGGEGRLWLSSDAFAEGVLIDNIAWATVPDAKPEATCPAAPAGWAASMPNGLRLGMTEAELKARLGSPSYQKDGLLGFLNIKRTWLSTDNMAVISSTVWAQVAGGKVVMLTLGQNTTNGGGAG